MLFQPIPPKKEADMELYAAIDLHSNNSVLVVTDSEDHVVFAKRLRNELEMIVTAMRTHRSHDHLELVAQPLGEHHVILRIRHDQHTVVGVQVNRSVKFHVGLLLARHRLKQHQHNTLSGEAGCWLYVYQLQTSRRSP